MDNITIEVWDTTGNKKQLVEVPGDAQINRVIAVLVDRMGLPRRSPDNQLMSYRLHHRATGRQLLDSETLTAAQVQNGDILRLQAEITAGALQYPRQSHWALVRGPAPSGSAAGLTID
jgi:hypothetical protein